LLTLQCRPQVVLLHTEDVPGASLQEAPGTALAAFRPDRELAPTVLADDMKVWSRRISRFVTEPAHERHLGLGTCDTDPCSIWLDEFRPRSLSNCRYGPGRDASSTPLPELQLKILALPAWNSSSVIAPEAFRSASFANPSAVLPGPAVCWT
jgi:hypothetical protein